MESILNQHYVITLEDVKANLTRYWRALRRELGDNDLLRDDFANTIRYELIKQGFDDHLEDEQLFNSILNC